MMEHTAKSVEQLYGRDVDEYRKVIKFKRLKWAAIGRGVNEYKEGDVVIHNYKYRIYRDALFNEEGGKLKLICPVEKRFDTV